MRTIVGTLAVLSLVAHLAFLPPTLEDLDSVNFALGVRHFDVAHHQPHPPGYPAFIALGKVGTAVLAMVGVPSPEARGLAVWSALGIAALPLLLFAFFRALDGDDRRACIATVLTVCSPLVWFTGSRPLSDVAGLAVACAALAALAAGWSRRASSESAESVQSSDVDVRWLLIGAFVAGLAIGFRSQMALLTLPLLGLILVTTRTHRLAIAGAAAGGIAIWAIPLVVLSGGPSGYIQALGSQAGEDFTGVVMLWTNPTPRVAFAAILQTFVRPWDSPMLAGVMLALAGAGLFTLAFRAPRTLAILLLTFGPYAIFHLLFQETLTLRYALPLMPLVGYLAAAVMAESWTRVSLTGAIALAAVSLAFAVPAATGFASLPSPVFGLLSEMKLLQGRGAAPVVAMHRRVFTESRRARVYDGDVPGRLLATPRDYEWLEMTRVWREGHDGETWFIADPRRTDLALVDREHSRTREYRWPFNAPVYVGGTRPNELDWHVFNQPGWFLEQGWALTPETAGIADRDGWGPHRRPSIGWIRRRPAETLMMIGGRHLGGDPPVRIVASIDDRPVATLDNVRPGYFLEFVKLPAGTLEGNGTYAKLTVAASSTGSGQVPPVGIEQFNVQTIDRVQFGYGDGWHEPEYNPATARSWRWMSERAVVMVHNAGHGVVFRIEAESPLHYFDASPVIRITVGSQLLAELHPTSDFTTTMTIPADVIAAANGQIVLTSDRTYAPGREGAGDARRLALRVYSLSVESQGQSR